MIKRNSVSFRVLKTIFIIFVMHSILSFGLIYLFEYERIDEEIEAQIESLIDAQYPAVIEGLWNYDYSLLNTLLDGFCSHKFIDYASVSEDGSEIVKSGTYTEGQMYKTISIVREGVDGPNPQLLGDLNFQINKKTIQTEINQHIILLLFFQLMLIIILSIVLITFMFRRVAKPLAIIAEKIGAYEAGDGKQIISLSKKNLEDEFAVLIDSFKSMSENIKSARKIEQDALRQLKESEKLNRILIDEAPDAILMFDLDKSRYISCNKRAEEIFGLSADELFNTKFDEIFPEEQPDGLPVEYRLGKMRTEMGAYETMEFERNIYNSNGEIRLCEARVTMLPLRDKKILRVSYLDVNDRVKAEKKVEKSLREKEVLLQEVYHRTKNNMQIIASLLNIQNMYVKDTETNEILEDMISRISAMALVHQKLYDSLDLTRIDLGEYLLDLVTEIKRAFIKNSRVDINLQRDAEVFLKLDSAIHCGLVLNELIVNAIKYAFPQKADGKIEVRLDRRENSGITVSVADNGIGLPDGFDFRTDGKLGFQTVISLVEGQLNGNISIVSEKSGTECILLLPNLIEA